MIIPFIFYLDEEGLISETKYRKEEIPVKNTRVKSFYDEDVLVYNVSGVISDSMPLFLNDDNKLAIIEKDEFELKIRKNIKQFLGFIKHLDKDIFKENYRNDPNLNYCMEFFAKEYLKDNSLKIKSKDISTEEFKESFNQIILLNSTQHVDMHKKITMRRFLRSSLTLVYDELNMIPLDYGNFKTSYDDEDDEKECLSTSEAFYELSNQIPGLCSNYNVFYKNFEKQNKKSKLSPSS